MFEITLQKQDNVGLNSSSPGLTLRHMGENILEKGGKDRGTVNGMNKRGPLGVMQLLSG